MKIVDYPDREMAAIHVADVLAGDLENALFNHDSVSFAVPGGSTPGPIFDALCAADLDWSRVVVFPTDERWVPSDDTRSNARLIGERLLTGRAERAQFISLTGDAGDPETAAVQQGAVLAAHLPISVLLLGMGADMHTASLFPGAPGLAEALSDKSPVLAVTRPETQPETRLSLSAPVLDGAMSKHLVIYGANKRAALERALTLPPEEAPVQAVLTQTVVHWAE